MFEAVIFDLDGLLVDSEPLQYRAFNEVFSRYGHPLSFDDYLRWRDWKLTSRWAELHNVPVNPEVIRGEKKDVYYQLIRDEMNLKPGARTLVKLAATYCRLCVASGSRIESIESCLEKFALKEHFEILISATMVTRGKPFPDVFLEAASQLSVSPEQALVVENSANGLRAAQAAGMSCIVCPDSSAPDPIEEYEGAALVVNSCDEVTFVQLEQLASDTHGT